MMEDKQLQIAALRYSDDKPVLGNRYAGLRSRKISDAGGLGVMRSGLPEQPLPKTAASNAPVFPSSTSAIIG
jgi:hypothetical protein